MKRKAFLISFIFSISSLTLFSFWLSLRYSWIDFSRSASISTSTYSGIASGALCIVCLCSKRDYFNAGVEYFGWVLFLLLLLFLFLCLCFYYILFLNLHQFWERKTQPRTVPVCVSLIDTKNWMLLFVYSIVSFVDYFVFYFVAVRNVMRCKERSWTQKRRSNRNKKRIEHEQIVHLQEGHRKWNFIQIFFFKPLRCHFFDQFFFMNTLEMVQCTIYIEYL